MQPVRLPGISVDDERYKREKRSRRKTGRKVDDLQAAPVPDRSCMTCSRWYAGADGWGDCRDAMVTRERVKPEDYAPDGLPSGTVIQRDEPTWSVALALGRPELLHTHQSFRACSRYERRAS